MLMQKCTASLQKNAKRSQVDRQYPSLKKTLEKNILSEVNNEPEQNKITLFSIRNN